MKHQLPPSPQRLMIFTRYPEAGKTKTRLISLLGEEGAADLQRQMTEETVQKARNLGGGQRRQEADGRRQEEIGKRLEPLPNSLRPEGRGLYPIKGQKFGRCG
jgi:hypothetical protein